MSQDEQNDQADEIAEELRESQNNYCRSDEEGWFYSDDDGTDAEE